MPEITPIAALARAFGQFGMFGEKRADMTASDLASGGLLSPTQRKPFLKGVYQSTPIWDLVTREVMNAKQHEISRLSMSGRILKKPPAENTEINSAQKVKPSTGKTSLSAKQFVGEVPISYRVILQNIDKEGFIEEVLNEVANQCGVDIAVTLMRGDTTLSTGVNDDQDALSVLDGWRVQANSLGTVYDAQNANVDVDLLAAIYESMPGKYIQNSALRMQFLAQYNLGLNWRRNFSRRQTVGGDEVAQHAEKAPPFWGRPVLESQEIATYTNATETCSDILFTDPKNLVAGIHEDIRIRVVDWPVTRSVRILVEVEVDCGFQRPEAVVLAKNVALLAA